MNFIIESCRIPLTRVENHPLVEQWLDRFERTKGSLTILKNDEFRDKSVKEIHEVSAERRDI